MRRAALTRGSVLSGLVLVVGGVNFATGLGTSSLYVDEGLTWNAASAPTLGEVVHRVSETEISPPLHYLAIHEIIGRVSDSEVAMRLPSVLAGIVLVCAILWMGTRAAGATAGIAAAALGALSPLLLEYSQEARSYVFVMLAVTCAAGALLEAERSEIGSRKRRRWLLGLAVASIIGFWMHYTAALVVLPLIASSLMRRRLTRREAVALGVAIGAGWALTAPLLLEQLGYGHERGVEQLTFLSAEHVVELFGTPFDSRFGYFHLTVWQELGALIVVFVGVITLARPLPYRPLLRSLILPAAFFPPAAVLLLTIVGPDVLLTRYTAVAAPFMLVLVGASVHTLGLRAAIATLGLALLAAVGGSVAAHTPRGRYPNWRAATAEIAKADRQNDVVILNVNAVGPVSAYYAARAHVRDLPALGADDPRSPSVVAQARRRGRRLWVFGEPAVKRARLEAGFATVGYRLKRSWTFVANRELQLSLALPTHRRTGARGGASAYRAKGRRP